MKEKINEKVLKKTIERCKEKNITLITSLHFLEFAKRYGSRIIGMNSGQIVTGSSNRLSPGAN